MTSTPWQQRPPLQLVKGVTRGVYVVQTYAVETMPRTSGISRYEIEHEIHLAPSLDPDAPRIRVYTNDPILEARALKAEELPYLFDAAWHRIPHRTGVRYWLDRLDERPLRR